MDKQEESDGPLVSGRIRKYTPKAKDIFEENISGYYKVLSEIRTSIIDGNSINELYAFKVVYQATEHKVRYGLRFIDERTAELNQLTQDSHDSKTSQSSHHSQASQSSHHSKTSQSSHHSKTSQSSHHSQASQSSHHSKTSQSSHHSQASQSSHHSKTSRSSHQSKSSQSSHSTKTSHRSSKDIYIDKKSKAETAKVRLKIIEEEETLKREQNKLELEVQKKRSDLESNLTVLKHKREVAEAEAELSVVKEVLEDKCDSISNKSGKLPDNEICTSEIVKSYVASQRPEVCVPVEETKLNPYVPEFVPSTTLPKEIKTSQPQQTMLVSETPTRWIDHASKYKLNNSVMYPPFRTFAEFIHSLAVKMNDPSFKFQQTESGSNRKDPEKQKFNNRNALNRQVLNTKKTKVENQNSNDLKCPVHEEGKHSLVECRSFPTKPLAEKREIIKKHGICFKCLKGKHLAKDCSAKVKCEKCGNSSHCTAFHIERQEPLLDNGGERKKINEDIPKIIGKDHEPYAQRLRLGWTIIGEACLGLVHTSDVITVNKTSVLPNQEITLKPCEYNFKVKDTKLEQKSEYSDIFEQTVEDNEVGLSREDKEFITIMENGVRKESNGNFSAPLPFRKDGTTLSNNYEQARKRAENLGRSFVAPVILGGRLIMRQALQNASVEWDDPLPEYLMNDWQVWKQSLKDLETLEIRRSFTETSLGDCSKYSTLFEVIEPEVDKEVRPLVEVKKTFVKSSGLDISLFEHFSTWTSLVRGIAFLKRKASMWHKDATDEKNSKSCVTFMKESEKLIIKEVQQDTYYNEIDCLKQSKPLQKNSSLIALSPVLDSDGLLRVGGRLKNSDIESCEKCL
ncbi:unnamed protein product [Mytilus edulis]|uniref:CCHC-type domain-containing protein n=1 Tax=Mytilus edulis TaxID=6550 RepID=A0A8S3V5R8_MYTED|nr:unnamed protein product [Mytilus edulis]